MAIDVYGVETERDGSAARVRCVVEFSGQARKAFGLEGLLPPSAVYRFELDVADEAEAGCPQRHVGARRAAGALTGGASVDARKNVTTPSGAYSSRFSVSFDMTRMN